MQKSAESKGLMIENIFVFFHFISLASDKLLTILKLQPETTWLLYQFHHFQASKKSILSKINFLVLLKPLTIKIKTQTPSHRNKTRKITQISVNFHNKQQARAPTTGDCKITPEQDPKFD